MGPEQFSAEMEKIAAAEAAKKSESKTESSGKFDPDKIKLGVRINPEQVEQNRRDREAMQKRSGQESFSDKVKRMERENQAREAGIIDRHKDRLKKFDEMSSRGLGDKSK